MYTGRGSRMSEVVGRYEILEQIGQGGFATVYRAKDPALGRLVALKVLRPGLLQNPDSAHRFNQEARTIARLDHPRIVTIHEFGQTDQQMFIVMRLIEGTSLDVRLTSEGPLAWTEALPIILRFVVQFVIHMSSLWIGTYIHFHRGFFD